MRAEENAYYVNKLRQNVGLETWIWGQIVTSQTGHTKYKLPPYATELNPVHEHFQRTPLATSHWESEPCLHQHNGRWPGADE